jgi:hypothetical protein
MGKWQSEEEINAELRKLAREVRALRTDLRRKTPNSGWPRRPHAADDRAVRQPTDEEGNHRTPKAPRKKP